MVDVLEFLLGVADLLLEGRSAWVRWLGIGMALLLLSTVLIAVKLGQDPAIIIGIVGTVVLVGGAIAVHDAFDTDCDLSL